MPLDPVEVEYCSVCSCPLEYCANAGCERVKLEKEMGGASISAGDGGDDDAPKATDAPATTERASQSSPKSLATGNFSERAPVDLHGDAPDVLGGADGRLRNGLVLE